MVEITVRGKEIDSKGRFVKGGGVSVVDVDLYSATRKLELLTRHESPKSRNYYIQSSFRVTPPNREVGSSIATATLVSGSTMVAQVVIDFDA